MPDLRDRAVIYSALRRLTKKTLIKSFYLTKENKWALVYEILNLSPDRLDHFDIIEI